MQMECIIILNGWTNIKHHFAKSQKLQDWEKPGFLDETWRLGQNRVISEETGLKKKRQFWWFSLFLVYIYILYIYYIYILYIYYIYTIYIYTYYIYILYIYYIYIYIYILYIYYIPLSPLIDQPLFPSEDDPPIPSRFQASRLAGIALDSRPPLPRARSAVAAVAEARPGPSAPTCAGESPCFTWGIWH